MFNMDRQEFGEQPGAYEVIAKVFIEVEKDIYIDQICRDNQTHQRM